MPSPPSPPSPKLGGHFTVLLLEDDRIQRELLGDALRSQGFVVIEAGDGKTALGLLREIHLDAVLADEHLPDMRGSDFFRQADRLAPPACVLLTADRDVVLRGSTVLMKPCDLEIVFAAVWRAAVAGRSHRMSLPGPA